jgi:hypothetical protein
MWPRSCEAKYSIYQIRLRIRCRANPAFYLKVRGIAREQREIWCHGCAEGSSVQASV